MSDSDQIRAQRLVYYEKDIERINGVLDEFMRLSGAKCSLLIDKEGHMIAKRGDTLTFDMETISALAAGSFAATKEMAKLLGEEEFSVLFHQGKRDSLQLVLVGDRMLMAIVFDDRTTIGMVRLYAKEATEHLTQVLQDAQKRAASGEAQPQISDDYGASAKQKLDDFFKS
ncbi:MAG: roadblock/LC7 domain-containing protein [Planctomycetota bacterium]